VRPWYDDWFCCSRRPRKQMPGMLLALLLAALHVKALGRARGSGGKLDLAYLRDLDGHQALRLAQTLTARCMPTRTNAWVSAKWCFNPRP